MGLTRNVMELSREEVERLVIKELSRKYKERRPLPIAIDWSVQSNRSFCHCWWTEGSKEKGDES